MARILSREKVKSVVNLIYSNRVILIVVLLGILLRVILMPFTIHHDILSSIWRGTLLVFEGSYRISHLPELIMAAYIFFMKSFLPHLPDLLGSHSGLTIAPDHGVYFNFLESIYSHRYVFIVKSVFLMVDLLMLVTILKSTLKKHLPVIIFWAINPFILYSAYLWGRFEIIPIYFMLLSMISSSKEMKWQAIIFAGLAVSSRINFLMYFLPLIIFISDSKKDYVKYLIAGLTPYIITSLFTKLLIESYSGINGGFQEYLFSSSFGQGFNSISLFPIAVFIIIYFMIKDKKSQKLDYKKYLFYTGIMISSYFAFTFFHPQWLAWLTPIAIMYIYYEKKSIYTLIIMFVLFFVFIDSYWGPYTSTYLLFEASNPDFAKSFFSIKFQLLGKYSDQTLITVFHTMFILSLILLNMQLKVKLYDKKK